MNRRPLRVAIIGAGTGGLCLAQGLKEDDICVDVFERDHSPTDRLQGYRLSINTRGAYALRTCLPPHLFEKLIENCANPSRAVSFLDHRLNRLLVIDLPRRHANDLDVELPVSRISLRSILLEGLDSIVHFGKKFVAFEKGLDTSVVAHFEDGSTAAADILVGADGAGSHLRSQLLPNAERVETGILAISGKFHFDTVTRDATPPEVFRGPTLILGPDGCFMFASAVEYGEPDYRPRGTRSRNGDGPNTRDSPGPYDRDQYVMWGFSSRREKFGLRGGPESLNPSDMRDAVLSLIPKWHPKLKDMVELADVASMTAFSVKTSVPIPAWETRNVTLLGDALHNMTPYRGIGANTALRDAAALRRALVEVDRGEAELIPSLAAYERNMIDYGFRAVRASLKQMYRVHSERPLQRVFTKTFFRAIDLVPPMKAAFRRPY